MRRVVAAALAACSLLAGCGSSTDSSGARTGEATVPGSVAPDPNSARVVLDPAPIAAADPIAGDWTHWRVNGTDFGWELRDIGRPKPPAWRELDVLSDADALAELAFTPQNGRYHADEFTRYAHVPATNGWLSLSVVRDAAGGIDVLRGIAEAGEYPAVGPYGVEPTAVAGHDGFVLIQHDPSWPTHVALWPVDGDLVVLSTYMIPAVEFRELVQLVEPVAVDEWQTMLDSARPSTEELWILGNPTWNREIELAGLDTLLVVSEVPGHSFCIGVSGDDATVRCTSRPLESEVWLTDRIVLETDPYTFGPLVVQDGVEYDAIDIVTASGQSVLVIHFDHDRPNFDFPDLAASD